MNVKVIISDARGNKINFTSEVPTLNLEETKNLTENNHIDNTPYIFLTKTAPDRPIIIYSDRFVEFE